MGRLLPLLLCLGTASCADFELPGELVWSGEYLDVYASEGLQACGGSFDFMDTFIGRLSAELGLHPPSSPVSFHFVDADDWASVDCAPHAAACFFPGEGVVSPDLPEEHELTHAVLDVDSEVPLLEEGLAEVFGTDYVVSPVASGPRVEDLLRENSVHYGVAGHFVGFLVERHGAAAVVELNEKTGAGYESIAAAFSEVLDSDLETELELYENYPKCESHGYRRALFECALEPESPLSPVSGWDIDVELGCEDQTALGPRFGEMWTIRTFDVSAALGETSMVLSREDDGVGRVEVFRCEPRCGEDRPYEVGAEGEPLRLREGRYWVKFTRPVDASGSFSLRTSIVLD